MAHHEEPMDIDSSVWDIKENSLNSNAFSTTPCTEKGYELTMKLRYSTTPSSLMSKSFTANCNDNQNPEACDNAIANDNGILTRSLNLNLTRNDKLPFQTLPLDQFIDPNRNPLMPLDSMRGVDNINVLVSKLDDNDALSLPSSSSSMAQTPEVMTPTMRRLKSVFNMLRPSLSPILPEDDNLKPKTLSTLVISPETGNANPQVKKLRHFLLTSTPFPAQRTKDVLSKGHSPNRESIVFNEDLKKELQCENETTISSRHENINSQITTAATDAPESNKSDICSSDIANQINLNSVMDLDIRVAEVHREPSEPDQALTQLRELLAGKEISAYNLKTETKELKELLTTLESQMRTLITSEEILKTKNELTEKLNEKTKVNKSMAAVVEEYDRTIVSLISEREKDRKLFNDLHSKYEKSKQVIFGFKANEEVYKKSVKESEENIAKLQKKYELLKHATSKLNHANEELQNINRAYEVQNTSLKEALLQEKKANEELTKICDCYTKFLEENLLQKTKAIEELTKTCDELLYKV